MNGFLQTSKCTYLMLFLLCILIGLSSNVLAYKDTFHSRLTELAVQNAKISSYVSENLGFELSERFLEKTAEDWITYGSLREDQPFGLKAVHHFENPVSPAYGYERYLTDAPFWFDTEPSALDRAEYDHDEGYSWEDAKEYYYLALTSQDKADRDKYFAMTFRAVGQVLHLLQDMGTPAHVRNDSHVLPGFYGTDAYEHFITDVPPEIPGEVPIPPPPYFSGFEHYWDSDKQANVYGDGLAEYANRNFVSDDTIFKDPDDERHYFAYPRKEDTNYDAIFACAEDGEWDETEYVVPITGVYEPSVFAAVRHLTAYVADQEMIYVWEKGCCMDETVAHEYALKLIPMTISYSAGLINYVFRGKMNAGMTMIRYPSNSGDYRLSLTIVNATGKDTEEQDDDEAMTNGTLSLYYEKLDGTYEFVSDRSGFSLASGTSFKWILSKYFGNEGGPEWPKGKFILVFRGNLGTESGAVIGKIMDIGQSMLAVDSANNHVLRVGIAESVAAGIPVVLGSFHPYDENGQLISAGITAVRECRDKPGCPNAIYVGFSDKKIRAYNPFHFGLMTIDGQWYVNTPEIPGGIADPENYSSAESNTVYIGGSPRRICRETFGSESVDYPEFIPDDFCEIGGSYYVCSNALKKLCRFEGYGNYRIEYMNYNWNCSLGDHGPVAISDASDAFHPNEPGMLNLFAIGENNMVYRIGLPQVEVSDLDGYYGDWVAAAYKHGDRASGEPEGSEWGKAVQSTPMFEVGGFEIWVGNNCNSWDADIIRNFKRWQITNLSDAPLEQLYWRDRLCGYDCDELELYSGTGIGESLESSDWDALDVFAGKISGIVTNLDPWDDDSFPMYAVSVSPALINNGCLDLCLRVPDDESSPGCPGGKAIIFWDWLNGGCYGYLDARGALTIRELFSLNQ